MTISNLKKRFAGGAAAAVLATSMIAMAPSEASAQWRHHGGNWGAPVAAGVVGGLALGALAAGAGGYGPYYGGPAYGAYGYGYGGCYLTRQRVWDGYGWRIQRVRVCD